MSPRWSSRAREGRMALEAAEGAIWVEAGWEAVEEVVG